MRSSDWSTDVCSSDLSAVGTMMMAGLSLQADGWAIAAPGIIAGIGMGLFFVPLTAVAFGRMEHEKLDEAAGRSAEHTSDLQSLMRSSYAVFCLKKKT